MTGKEKPKTSINLSDIANPNDIVVKYISDNNAYQFIALSKFLDVFIHRLKVSHPSGMFIDLRMNTNFYGKVDILESGYPLQILWPNQPWRNGNTSAAITLEFVMDAPPHDPEPSLLDDLR